MLFFSFFKTLVNHEVTVELKNDISIRGTLKSVDQYLNIKLDDITVVDELKYPHLVSTLSICRSEGTRRKTDESELRAFDPERQEGTLLTVRTELGQERLHQGQCRTLCASSCRCCRHTIAGGCDEKR
jgi:small nuclear ribonucleoprotein (snRNP)-like protein